MPKKKDPVSQILDCVSKKRNSKDPMQDVFDMLECMEKVHFPAIKKQIQNTKKVKTKSKKRKNKKSK